MLLVCYYWNKICYTKALHQCALLHQNWSKSQKFDKLQQYQQVKCDPYGGMKIWCKLKTTLTMDYPD